MKILPSVITHTFCLPVSTTFTVIKFLDVILIWYNSASNMCSLTTGNFWLLIHIYFSFTLSLKFFLQGYLKVFWIMIHLLFLLLSIDYLYLTEFCRALFNVALHFLLLRKKEFSCQARLQAKGLWMRWQCVIWVVNTMDSL